MSPEAGGGKHGWLEECLEQAPIGPGTESEGLANTGGG